MISHLVIYVFLALVAAASLGGCSTWEPRGTCRKANYTNVETNEPEDELADEWACKRSWKIFR